MSEYAQIMCAQLLRSREANPYRWILLFLCIVNIATGVQATVLSDWPDWAGGKRVLKVFIRPGSGFDDKIREAMDRWNRANEAMGVDWRFEETQNPSNADIDIGKTTLQGAGGGGLSTPTIGGDDLTEVNIGVDPTGLTMEQLLHTIMHELGHAMRLDHTPGLDDIMQPGPGGRYPIVPSATDKDEAEASDDDPPCPLTPSSHLIRGSAKTIKLIPKTGASISLVGLEDVRIDFTTGPDVIAEVLTWDDSKIDVRFEVAGTAAHNEVFEAQLQYPDRKEVFTGVLTITDDEAPPNALPHAVAGPDITVFSGVAVTLDGRASFHDKPDVFSSGTWLVVSRKSTNVVSKGLWSEYGQLNLEPGSYEATYTLKDYYGRMSQDSLLITVSPWPRINVTAEVGGRLSLTWEPSSAKLEWADSVVGPWSAISSAESPYKLEAPLDALRFFRVRDIHQSN